MRRLLAFVVRNWPLKLAAVLLATLLYAGLVLSQSAQVWPGGVPITPLKLPTSAFLLTNLPQVTNIRYFAPADVAGRLTSANFVAWVDLSNAAPTADNPFVITTVHVRSTDQRVTILDYDPPSIRVQLDPLVKKIVSVQVDHGVVPPGFEIRSPILSVDQVTISGPESIIRLVTAVQARVVIQPSGIDVDQDVDLVAVDARGEVQAPVDIKPSSVHVKIAVGSGLQSKTLPVNPVVTGTPASGYQVTAVSVTPVVIAVEGDANALAGLSRVDTLPVALGGATDSVAKNVGLALPDGVTTLATDSVTVSVTLQEVAATRTFSAGIVLSGALDNRTYALSTDSMLVTVGGLVSVLDGLQATSFVVVADVDGLGPGVHKVKPTVTLPSGVSLVATSPADITVTIADVATSPPSPTPTPSGP